MKSSVRKGIFLGILALVFLIDGNGGFFDSNFDGLIGPGKRWFASQTCLAKDSQIEVVPYQNVSPQKLKNVTAAVEITETLLAETGFALSEPVKVVVTENEADYAGAIGQYAGLSPEKAAEKAGLSTGISLPQKPVIILQGMPRLEKYPVTAYILLPHEIFHQAQKHDGVVARIKAPSLLSLSALTERLSPLDAIKAFFSGTFRRGKE